MKDADNSIFSWSYFIDAKLSSFGDLPVKELQNLAVPWILDIEYNDHTNRLYYM